MTLPDAARYTGAFAGSYSGFSVPGIEIYEHDCEGAPCEPCEVDEGDTCRPHWVNRQDHGMLSRLNVARADHPNTPYGWREVGLECTVPELRTTVYPGTLDECGFDPARDYPEHVAIVGTPPGYQRRFLAQRLRQGAQARSRARSVAGAQAVQQVRRALAGGGYVEESRPRRQWGNHENHNGHSAVGIRYIPMAGEHGTAGTGMQGDFDCLIVAPGHVRCDFYEE